MKKKIVIRIRRKNEFNWYWVFLIFWSLTLLLTAIKVNMVFQAFILIFAALIILILALLYQGFEVIKE